MRVGSSRVMGRASGPSMERSKGTFLSILLSIPHYPLFQPGHILDRPLPPPNRKADTGWPQVQCPADLLPLIPKLPHRDEAQNAAGLGRNSGLARSLERGRFQVKDNANALDQLR